MAKIILSLRDKNLREIPLTKERVTIGRHPQNDVVIDDLAISSEHAVIVTTNDDSFLEDLNSTNGTQVNGQPIRKHYLQDKDCIELAQYRIRYLTATSTSSIGTITFWQKQDEIALLKVLNGASAGVEVVLNRPITTIGKAELHTAVILQRADGYYLAHVEGRSLPSLNGRAIGQDPRKLMKGDVIEISGVRVQFC